MCYGKNKSTCNFDEKNSKMSNTFSSCSYTFQYNSLPFFVGKQNYNCGCYNHLIMSGKVPKHIYQHFDWVSYAVEHPVKINCESEIKIPKAVIDNPWPRLEQFCRMEFVEFSFVGGELKFSAIEL